MPTTHLVAWEQHLQRMPFGDSHTQLLLARVIQMFHATQIGMSGKKGKVAGLIEIAPWLCSRQERLDHYQQVMQAREKQREARDRMVRQDMQSFAKMMQQNPQFRLQEN